MQNNFQIESEDFQNSFDHGIKEDLDKSLFTN